MLKRAFGEEGSELCVRMDEWMGIQPIFFLLSFWEFFFCVNLYIIDVPPSGYETWNGKQKYTMRNGETNYACLMLFFFFFIVYRLGVFSGPVHGWALLRLCLVLFRRSDIDVSTAQLYFASDLR